MREDAARPRACPVLDTGVIRRGIDCWESCETGSGRLTSQSQTDASEKTQLAQGAKRPWGKLRSVKRPACFQRQTGACRSCGSAACQPCRGHEEPAGATDLSAIDRRLRPTGGGRSTGRAPSLSPAAGGEQPQPADGSQRKERSTPTVRRVSSGRSDQLQSLNGCPAGEGLITPTAGLDRGRRAKSTPSFRSALPAKDQRQLRFGSIPSWETGGERIILRSYPCNRDHAPRFLWSETLEKA